VGWLTVAGYREWVGRSARVPDNQFMSISIEMLAGGFLLLISGAFTCEAGRLNITRYSAESWLPFLYLILFGSIIAFTAYIWLLKHVQATRAGTYSYVNPIIAVFLGWLILSVPLSAQLLVSAAIIAAVVLIIAQEPAGEPDQNSGEQIQPSAPPVREAAAPEDLPAFSTQVAAAAPDCE